jgi:protein SCO1/2
VDPARDSGELLASYLDHFVARGHALRTTDAAAQQAAQDAFGVVARQVPEGDGYSIEHTAVTYVVDDTGKVVVEWPFGTQPDVMADDLRFLFEQQADEERRT